MTPTDPTEEPTITDRGFMRFDPIAVDRGHSVQVYESSAADGLKVWLRAAERTGDEITVHVGEDAALTLVRQIVYLLDHHHNADEPEPAPPTSVEEPWAAAAMRDPAVAGLVQEIESAAAHLASVWAARLPADEALALQRRARLALAGHVHRALVAAVEDGGR